MRAAGAEPLFQRYVSGGFQTIVTLVGHGNEILSQHLQLTTRKHGSGSGLSARAASVAIPDDLAGKVRAFLADHRWFGLAVLQFLVPKEGEPQFIDFNGRFYGSLGLANACGMRAMDSWARLATGRVAIPSESRLGVAYQSLEGDLRWVWSEQKTRLVPAAIDCLIEATRTIHPVLSWRDPLPVLQNLARISRRAFSKTWKQSI